VFQTSQFFEARDLFKVFAYGLTSFSSIPLVLFLILGIVITAASIFSFLIILALQIVGQSINSNVWLADALFFTSGIQLLGIGTLGVYLARVFQDVRHRPRYIISSTLNLDENRRQLTSATPI